MKLTNFGFLRLEEYLTLRDTSKACVLNMGYYDGWELTGNKVEWRHPAVNVEYESANWVARQPDTSFDHMYRGLVFNTKVRKSTAGLVPADAVWSKDNQPG